MIWYQKFEYAVGHWLQKASEHVFGCVLCCPGCFSLFRASALVDHNVLKTYTREPEEGKDLVQFEQGEDRWLCTLLLKRGYKIDYCAGADARTFAPEDFKDFFIQRRRWSPSTLANMIDLVMSWREIVNNNSQISHFFMLYQCVMVGTSIVAPATVLILISGSFSTVLEIDAYYSFLVALGPVIAFALSCFLCKQAKQLLLAGILSTIYTFVMIIVTVGMILNIVSESIISPNVLFLAFVGVVFVVAAIIHPKEFTCVIPGILYYVTVPSTFIFLTVYFVCNLNDVSWGTREKKTEEAEETTAKSFINLVKDIILRRLVKELPPEDAQRFLNKNKKKKQEGSNEQCNNEETSNTNNPPKDPEIAWLDQLSKAEFTMQTISVQEKLFWDEKIKEFLKPLESDAKKQERFRTELLDMRNKCVYGFFMMNLMLAIALLQLQISRDQLKNFYIMGKYEPVSIIFLAIFALLLFIQVLGMLKHRWGTFLHLISSTELKTEKEDSFDAVLNGIEDKYENVQEENFACDVNEPDRDYSDASDSETSADSGSIDSNIYRNYVTRNAPTVRLQLRNNRRRPGLQQFTQNFNRRLPRNEHRGHYTGHARRYNDNSFSRRERYYNPAFDNS